MLLSSYQYILSAQKAERAQLYYTICSALISLSHSSLFLWTWVSTLYIQIVSRPGERRLWAPCYNQKGLVSVIFMCVYDDLAIFNLFSLVNQRLLVANAPFFLHTVLIHEDGSGTLIVSMTWLVEWRKQERNKEECWVPSMLIFSYFLGIC